LIRASLIALARRLILIRPRLILITRRLVAITRPLLTITQRAVTHLIKRTARELGTAGRTPRNPCRFAAGWTLPQPSSSPSHSRASARRDTDGSRLSCLFGRPWSWARLGWDSYGTSMAQPVAKPSPRRTSESGLHTEIIQLTP